MNKNRILIVTGHLFFLVYFFFAAIYAEERVLFVDTAYQFFKIINYESFNIEAGRFPAVITQIPLLVGVKLHLPLKYLVFIFSLTFPALYYLVYLLSVHYYKKPAAGIVLALSLCICIRHSFFHAVTETHQALAYSALFFAWLYSASDSKNQFRQIISGSIILVLAAFSHPVAYLTLAFVLLFYFFDKQPVHKTLLGFASIAIVGIVIFKYVSTPSGTYEGQFLSQIKQFSSLIFDMGSLSSKWFYDHFYNRLYRLPFYMIVFVSVYYLITFNFRKLLVVPLSYFAFLAFTLLLYNAGDSQIMMERAFMPLAFFAGLPLINDVLAKGNRFKWLKAGVVIAMLSYGMNWIYRTSDYFTDRVEYIGQFVSYMDENEMDKLLVGWDNTSNSLIYIPWAFGVETLIYSSMNDIESDKTVFIYFDAEKKDFDLKDPKLFLLVHFDRNNSIDMLNEKYFKLPAKSYQMMNAPFKFKE